MPTAGNTYMKCFTSLPPVVLLCISSAGALQAATVLTGDARILPAGVRGGLAEAGIGGAPPSDTGSILIDGGTVVTLFSGTSSVPDLASAKVDIGDEPGGNGSLKVEGVGTALILESTGVAARFEVGGLQAQGTVDITNSASVLVSSDTNSFVIVGDELGGDGIMNIADATFEVTSDTAEASIGIGTNGSSNGKITVQNGAQLSVVGRTTSQVAVGRNDGSGNVGEILIDGSTGTIGDGISDSAVFGIGQAGAVGTAVIDNGSVVDVIGGSDGGDVEVGAGQSATGTLTIANGSQLSISAGPGATGTTRLAVGSSDDAIGRLNINSGGTVQVTGPNAVMDIGDPSPSVGGSSVGIVTVDGPSSRLIVENNILVGKFSGNGSTTGLLRLENGGGVETTNLNVRSGGIVSGCGNGTISASVGLSGGGIAPGCSPGVLDIFGDLVIGAESFLDIEIEGALPTEYDLLNVLGNLSATGDFSINLIFDQLPEVGDMYDFLTFTTANADFLDFVSLNLIGLGEGSIFDISIEDNKISAVARVVVPAAPIPLPASVWLILSGLVPLLGMKRFGRNGRRDLVSTRLI